MRFPEYAWAQRLLVAVHSLVLAYEKDKLSINDVGESGRKAGFAPACTQT